MTSWEPPALIVCAILDAFAFLDMPIVCLGSLADMATNSGHIGFTPDNRHSSALLAGIGRQVQSTKPFSVSHFWIRSATWALFLSIIIMWEFPLMPTSGRLTTSTLPPAARTAST